MDIHPQPFTTADILASLREGGHIALQTRTISVAYAALFALIGAIIIGLLLYHGFAPFIIAAAGAFMLIGPVILAGFFGIARDYEKGQTTGISSIHAGFTDASSVVWVISLVCTLLFMVFITDAATLYSFMVGRTPVWLTEITTEIHRIHHFLLWGSLSGLAIAFMLYCVSVFSVPLLCEHRVTLVQAVMASVSAVFRNFVPAMLWGGLLAGIIITSILLLPLLLITLPWLAHASRVLFHKVFP